MREERLLSFGAVALAFFGTQHHNLMFLLLALGLGEASTSAMTDSPMARDAMLALSVAMAAVIAYRISTPRRSAAMRLSGAVSIILTLGLAGWSVLHFGL